METAEQNTKQVMEENEVLKQLIELFNQQDMGGQSQDFMGIFWYVAGMQMQLPPNEKKARNHKASRKSIFRNANGSYYFNSNPIYSTSKHEDE